RTALAGTAAALGAAVLLYLIGVPVLRRGIRRRRLFAADPRDRVTGAWLEVRDALRLARQPAPPHLTATEVAGHAPVAARRPARGGAPPRPPPRPAGARSACRPRPCKTSRSWRTRSPSVLAGRAPRARVTPRPASRPPRPRRTSRNCAPAARGGTVSCGHSTR